ncbi:astrotactin-2 [Platysternon megacephalum]|uniref:Astrotactin-2 n=1 Tax=Platysternon megacephalum TaxID=55544 RepID=A0A4D9EP93_9SAUR|nr:astrotactin-2 [Platysternon megacephalum]
MDQIYIFHMQILISWGKCCSPFPSHVLQAIDMLTNPSTKRLTYKAKFLKSLKNALTISMGTAVWCVRNPSSIYKKTESTQAKWVKVACTSACEYLTVGFLYMLTANPTNTTNAYLEAL